MKIKKYVVPLILSVLILVLASLTLVGQRHPQFAQWGLTRFLNKLETSWYDFKFKTRQPQRAEGVMVARIDDLSLQRFGRWPWTRAVYKEILDLLFEKGASVVAFDAVFSEPEYRTDYVRSYLNVPPPGQSKSLVELLPLKPEQVDLLSTNFPLVGDQIFANAITENPRTVLGYIWEGKDACSKDSFEVDLANLSRHGIFAEGQAALNGESVKTLQVPTFLCPVANRPVIQKDAQFQGFFNSFPGEDGIFRKAQLLLSFYPPAVPAESREWMDSRLFQELVFFPSLSLAALAAHWESPGMRVEMGADDHGRGVRKIFLERKGLSPLEIQTQGDASFLLNFYGSQRHKPFAPIAEFSLGNIEGDLSQAEFQTHYKLDPLEPLKNQIVVIGPTALGVYDLRPNSVQEDALGVYLHATAIGRLLELAKDPSSPFEIKKLSLRHSLFLIWILGFLFSFLLMRARALWGALLTVVGMLGLLLIDFVVFSRLAVATDAVAVVNTVVALFLAIFAYKYLTEERDRAFVKQAFEKYVSPEIVGAILEDPKKLNLGGQRKELSVLFSDIRGFTAFSEKMNASELAKFLNGYLSPMTDVILGTRGTIDKYVGDAIMAIFGAPVDDPLHPTHAVKAALGMLKKLAELKVIWAKAGLPEVEIGVGINTGEMSVGNMGSDRIFSYTVMGDAVNLGSRLEGLTKEYGVHLIVSEFTRKHLGEAFVLRELDQVKVKGKKEAVRIFEVLAVSGESVPEWLPSFNSALQDYYSGHFAKALEVFNQLSSLDPPSKIFLRRCELLLKSPPGMGWDGTWTMTSK